MPWFVIDTETVHEYVCLCDPAVDRAKMTTEEEEAYERCPSPSMLPVVDGMKPQAFKVHALKIDVVLEARLAMIGRIGDDPEKDDPEYSEKNMARKIAAMKASREHDVTIVKAGVMNPDGIVEDWPEALITELSGLIRSLSSGDTVLRGN